MPLLSHISANTIFFKPFLSFDLKKLIQPRTSRESKTALANPTKIVGALRFSRVSPFHNFLRSFRHLCTQQFINNDRSFYIHNISSTIWTMGIIFVNTFSREMYNYLAGAGNKGRPWSVVERLDINKWAYFKLWGDGGRRSFNFPP